jgi:hypothetical protein
MKKYPFEGRIIRPFKYVPASQTNVAATIQRARKAIEEAERPATNVRPLARKQAA